MVKSMVLRELHTLEETTMDKVRFLMSDTGAQITEACREALEQKGVEVTVVEKDGNKVLQKMLAVRPQVVLLDAFMPGLDALAVKQRYNAAGERHTHIVVDDERNPIPGSNFFDLHCFLYHFFMGKFFFAKLQKRRSVFENVFNNIGKTSAV